jgi:hypothetical protein
VAEEEPVVVDRGEVPSHQQNLLGQVHIGPVQSEGFPAAHAGAQQQFEQVGELVRVVGVVVAQEGGGLAGVPADPLSPAAGRGMSACRQGLSAMSRVRTAPPSALDRVAPVR